MTFLAFIWYEEFGISYCFGCTNCWSGGRKDWEVACTSPAFFFWSWHSILTSFILAKRHTAGDHTYWNTVLLQNTLSGAISQILWKVTPLQTQSERAPRSHRHAESEQHVSFWGLSWARELHAYPKALEMLQIKPVLFCPTLAANERD